VAPAAAGTIKHQGQGERGQRAAATLALVAQVNEIIRSQSGGPTRQANEKPQWRRKLLMPDWLARSLALVSALPVWV